MVRWLRDSALFVVCLFTLFLALPKIVFADDENIRITTTADEGRPGEDGYNQPNVPPTESGRDGRNGGHARRGGEVDHSDATEVWLSFSEDRKHVIVRSYRIPRRGQARELPEQRIRVDSKAMVIVDTRGQNGVRGYHAGRPQPGSNGRRGRDGYQDQAFVFPVYQGEAPGEPGTRLYHIAANTFFDTAPTEGQRGGDTGRPGRATDGNDGAHAGAQKVFFSESDPILLAAYLSLRSGGKGGSAGRTVARSQMPKAGSGGAGGEGVYQYRISFNLEGTQYEETFERWDTPRQETVYRQTGDGNTAKVIINIPAAVPDGPHGSDGEVRWVERENRRKGRNGRNETITYVAESEDGNQRQFDEAWNLVLDDITFEGNRPDGRVETGEVVTIRAKLKNVGKIFAPAGVQLTLSASKGLEVVGGPQTIGRIDAGEETDVIFQVRGRKVEPTEGFGDKTTPQFAKISGSLPEFGGRRVPGFSSRTINLQTGFPLHLASGRALDSIAPGEATYVDLTVTNTTGINITREALADMLLNMEGINADQVCLVDENERHIRPEEGWSTHLTGLKANQSRTYRLILGARDGAQSGARIEMTLGVRLELLNGGGVVPIQNAKMELRIAARFNPDPNAEVVLVVTPFESEENIQEAIGRLAPAVEADKVALFRLGSEPVLDLNTEYNGERLGEYLQGKTLVVLNSPFEREPFTDRRIYPDELRKNQQFRDAVAEGQFRVVYVGEGEDLMGNTGSNVFPANTTSRQGPDSPRIPHRRYLNEREPLPSSGGVHDGVEVFRRTFLFAPSNRSVHRLLDQFALQVARATPEQRQFLMDDYHRSRVRIPKRSFWGLWIFFQNWHVADVDVARSQDQDTFALAEISAESPENLLSAFLMVQPFNIKLLNLVDQQSMNDPYSALTVQAVAATLVRELMTVHLLDEFRQEVYKGASWWTRTFSRKDYFKPLSEEEVEQALTRWEQFASAEFLSGEFEAGMVEIIASMKVLAAQEQGAIKTVADRIIERAMANVSNSDNFAELVRKRVIALNQDAARFPGRDAREKIVNMLLDPTHETGRFDGFDYYAPGDRQVSFTQRDSIGYRESERNGFTDRYEDEINRQRRELLVPGGCPDELVDGTKD